MYKYEKLAELLYQPLNISKSDEEDELSKIWKEKEKLIDSVMRLYWNVVEAYCNCYKNKSYFTDELITIDKLIYYIKSPDWDPKVSLEFIH